MEGDININNFSFSKEIGTYNNELIIKQKKWSKEEDNLLLIGLEDYGNTSKKWKIISSFIKNKSPSQCYSRFKQINPQINKGYWSQKEDDDLRYYISKFGRKWTKISRMMKSRNNKQIRDRFLNVLDENLEKKHFSEEEDQQILSLIYKFGSNWSKMTQEMKGRSAANIKNRFYYHIRHRIDPQIDLGKISKFHINQRQFNQH